MTDATLDKVDTAADQADAGVKEGARALSDHADQVRKTVTEKAGQAKEWAGDRAGVARDWALDQSDVIRDTVQTKPFISVGVSAASAFAAGLVLGVLLTRR
jgi:ElaB/YqjD/DUF883 family membrane-anchored ribosome-binding protein